MLSLHENLYDLIQDDVNTEIMALLSHFVHTTRIVLVAARVALASILEAGAQARVTLSNTKAMDESLPTNC